MFPFTNYKKINVPQTNSNNAVVYTTTAKCMLFFIPIGSRMEDDAAVGLYVQDWYIDTDSDNIDFYLHYSQGISDGTLNRGTVGSDNGSNTPCVCDAGKNIRAFIANSSDRIGGTLYVFELPS